MRCNFKIIICRKLVSSVATEIWKCSSLDCFFSFYRNLRYCLFFIGEFRYYLLEFYWNLIKLSKHSWKFCIISVIHKSSRIIKLWYVCRSIKLCLWGQQTLWWQICNYYILFCSIVVKSAQTRAAQSAQPAVQCTPKRTASIAPFLLFFALNRKKQFFILKNLADEKCSLKVWFRHCLLKNRVCNANSFLSMSQVVSISHYLYLLPSHFNIWYFGDENDDYLIFDITYFILFKINWFYFYFFIIFYLLRFKVKRAMRFKSRTPKRFNVSCAFDNYDLHRCETRIQMLR